MALRAKNKGRVFHKSIAMFWVFAVNFGLAMCFSAAAIYFVEGGEWDEEEMNYMRLKGKGYGTYTATSYIYMSYMEIVYTIYIEGI